MPRIHEGKKYDRKERVYRYIQRFRDGVSEREIADDTNIERRSIHNYLTELSAEGKIYKDGQLWLPLPYESVVLRRFDPDPEEATLLYLAMRLFVKQSDRRKEKAEILLTKLSDILSSDIGLGEILHAAAHEMAQRPKDTGYEDILLIVIRGYIYRRQVRIIYSPYKGKPFETIISPYLLEPSAIGLSTYVIGHSSIVSTLRTYKVERVIEAQLLLHNEYTIPEDFPGLELLRNAWSIYYGDEVVRVILRFHPEVARRVQETNWHPSQQLAEDTEKSGYLLLSFDVADTTDLKPWIRTWGANCEVLSPSELRDELMGEARRLALLYGWKANTSDSPDHSRFGDIFGG
ncbi:MAG: WYL domain-containing protein [Chloroflexi bacterium]|nr:WYL domain-containing protein [Chloroflexota bacterium]